MYQDQRSYDGKVRLLDVTSEQFLTDPYRFYRERREVDSIIQVRDDVYSLTGYSEMAQVLGHPNAGRYQPDAELDEMKDIRDANPILGIINKWMLFHNPPKHTRVRKLVLKAFTPRMVRSLEPFMRSTIRDLIEKIKADGDGKFDLVESISYPFPVSVISEMMGIPEEDRDLFRQWSTDFAIALAMDLTTLPPEVRERMNKSALALTQYFEGLIGTFDENQDNLLTNLVTASEDGDNLTTAEILSNCTLLLVAGHETTTSLLSNGMNALLSNPDQIDLLRSDPGLIPNAVEEFLRYDPPVQSIGRYMMDDIELESGFTFPKGSHVSTIIGAAGRDPLANQNPDNFDVTREGINHLSFAKGIHYCLGANLARTEARVAYEELLEAFGSIKPEGPPVRGKNWLLRGFSKMPLRFS